MGIEELLKGLTVSLDKNTAQLGEVLAALQGNTAILQTVQEGREEALATLTAKDADAPKPARRSSKKAAEAEPAPEPATEEKAEPTDESVSCDWNPDTSVDGMRTLFGGYLNTEDDTEKQLRIGNVQAILAEIGVEAINPMEGKKHLESEDDRRKAAFYVTRFAAGLPVDFKADYDFSADPLTQEGGNKAAPADDLVG